MTHSSYGVGVSGGWSVWDVLAVLGAGLGGGFLSTTVGVASLLSFPVLLAVGIPPVMANASNTVGLVAGGFSGSLGYRDELRANPALSRQIVVACAVGAVAGALLLIGLPAGVFEAIVPWLILFTCLLVGVQPWLAAQLRRRAGQPPDPVLVLGPIGCVLAFVVGIYGGYFGAGAGVMMMALLGLATDISIVEANGLKTLSLFVGNVVASVVFLFIAPLDWAAIGLLCAGSLIGGYVGARVGRRIPAGLLRALVVIAGVVAALMLF